MEFYGSPFILTFFAITPYGCSVMLNLVEIWAYLEDLDNGLKHHEIYVGCSTYSCEAQGDDNASQFFY
jgi:hypothetical protein